MSVLILSCTYLFQGIAGELNYFASEVNPTQFLGKTGWQLISIEKDIHPRNFNLQNKTLMNEAMKG